MDELINKIKLTLNIPFVEIGNTLLKECFLVELYDTGGSRGDGQVIESTAFYQISIYTKNRTRTIALAKNLVSMLKTISAAYYMPTYRNENGYMRAIIKIEVLEDENL